MHLSDVPQYSGVADASSSISIYCLVSKKPDKTRIMYFFSPCHYCLQNPGSVLDLGEVMVGEQCIDTRCPDPVSN